ncbi:MAG: YifB family Mg chelatase-like AAA ATPase [Lachnospiraceae bacterium]|nr:YifB family Mg chelatase-like AAA ATPase [Lachnospiraceae bacterium]
MFSDTLTAMLEGVKARIIHVETDISNGMPVFNMVGSVGNEIREAKDRIRAAFKNLDISIPASRITVNLSPGDLKKDSTAYDLPIAVGLLGAMRIFPEENTQGVLFLGEIGLNGEIRPVKGVLPVVRTAASEGIKECIVPRDNAFEGSIVPGITVRGASDLNEVISYLSDRDEDILPSVYTDPLSVLEDNKGYIPDFDQVRGQERAKRAAMISASGFHSLLMTGPPGAGKSMIARRIPGILPPMNLSESMELTSIYSVAGCMPKGKALVSTRAFQAPHHSITRQALIGGGMIPKPGMISLAHRSVLFLDEVPEFSREAIESLRQPLEDKSVRITRLMHSVEFPADFLLILAMNPCPCGYYPDRGRCRCTDNEIRRYIGKISGPLLDRIDLCTELRNVDISEMRTAKSGLDTKSMSEKVIRARNAQNARYEGTSIRFNADLKPEEVEKYCRLDAECLELTEKLYKNLNLSARSYHRILRVSRTIADMEESEEIKRDHVMEAASFRPDLDYFK